MIRSFRDKEARELFHGGESRRFRALRGVVLRKLDMLDAARTLADLRMPRGNRLEALAGSRKGQHSIRVNDQWRICFIWRDDGAHEVEIVDYH
ncbi:MAG TPA: type II toxin-antitoxin system RelE/ParE family toxin [Alphaproteobacteria bacterium]|nr:type II toxin-antitoxin system RelE/ParE family toxin [Alphaproteobacteria bacterium]